MINKIEFSANRAIGADKLSRIDLFNLYLEFIEKW